jgi:hypothetical protein
MQHVSESGTTIVAVSHSLHAIRRLCERTLLVDRGRLLFDGDTGEAIAMYHRVLSEPRDVDDPVEFKDYREEAGTIRLISAGLVDNQNHPSAHFRSGDEIRVALEMEILQEVGNAVVSLVITTDQGTDVYNEAWPLADTSAASMRGAASARISCAGRLSSGSYNVRVLVSTPDLAVIYGALSVGSFFVTGREGMTGIVDLAGSLAVFESAEPVA